MTLMCPVGSVYRIVVAGIVEHQAGAVEDLAGVGPAGLGDRAGAQLAPRVERVKAGVAAQPGQAYNTSSEC